MTHKELKELARVYLKRVFMGAEADPSVVSAAVAIVLTPAPKG